MGLSSFFKRGDKSPAAKPVNDSQDAVQHLRVRARRRLIGAAVLVAVGVVGFPLLFETQPRPIPVDLPIDIPRKEAAPALVVPAPLAQASVPVIANPPAQAVEQEVIEGTEKITQTQGKPVDKPAEKALDKTADTPTEKVPDKPIEKAKPAVPARNEAARVQAILEGKNVDKPASSVAADKSRFIVQVGAFADTSSAQEARMKVERVGLKTYTQAVDTPGGRRIRVRVGPFTDRAEADKVVAKLRGTGLSTAVLTL
ncbi:MAG: SPOR domain-containing protein [Paucibacter sp.]|nr:SPOR domain-containing protein [Roseateles sp.]